MTASRSARPDPFPVRETEGGGSGLLPGTLAECGAWLQGPGRRYDARVASGRERGVRTEAELRAWLSEQGVTGYAPMLLVKATTEPAHGRAPPVEAVR